MEDTTPKPFVFVLMPFSSEFTDVYEVGIKPACKDAGAYCERVDEEIFFEDILERVYNQIAKADIIVAEMSGRNPNVFYETGYAHALNKRVILLTKNADDIPFNLNHFPHIIYESKIATLKSQLEARIRWCVDNPLKSLASVDIDLEFFVNGIPLVSNPEIKIFFNDDERLRTIRNEAFHQAELKISFHNKTNRLINSGSYSLALVMHRIFSMSVDNYHQLNDEQFIWNLSQSYAMFPGSFQSLNIGLQIIGGMRDKLQDGPFDATLRLFTEVGTRGCFITHPELC